MTGEVQIVHDPRSYEVLCQIRDLLGQRGPGTPAPAAPPAKPVPKTTGKLTSAQVAKHIGMSRKQFNNWVDRHPELERFEENRGRGRSSLWEVGILYWFEDHRDKNGRFRE